MKAILRVSGSDMNWMDISEIHLLGLDFLAYGSDESEQENDRENGNHETNPECKVKQREKQFQYSGHHLLLSASA